MKELTKIASPEIVFNLKNNIGFFCASIALGYQPSQKDIYTVFEKTWNNLTKNSLHLHFFCEYFAQTNVFIHSLAPAKSIDKLLLDAESIVTKKSNDNYGLDEQENFSNLLEILGNSNLNDDILAKINLGDTILTYTNTAPEIDGFVAPTSIKDYYKLFDILKEAINNLKTNKNLTQNEIDILRTKAFLLLLYLSKIEFSTFQTLSEYYKTGQINLEPNSISIIDFETFCLRSGAPAPTTHVEPMTLEIGRAHV